MTISFGLLLLEIVLNAESTIFQHVIAFLLIVFLVLIAVMVPYMFGLGLMTALFILQGIFENLIFISKKVGADGVLLLIGTVVFIISRVIAIQAAIQ